MDLKKKNHIFLSIFFSIHFSLSSFAQVLPQPLPSLKKCMFIKKYDEPVKSNNSIDYKQALLRITQLETLISINVLEESLDYSICKIDNKNYSEIQHEIEHLKRRVYERVKSGTGSLDLVNNEDLIKKRIKVLKQAISTVSERLNNLEELEAAVKEGKELDYFVPGVDNFDQFSVSVELKNTKIYYEELDQMLFFWKDLAKRIKK